jgi:hypothetical protein
MTYGNTGRVTCVGWRVLLERCSVPIANVLEEMREGPTMKLVLVHVN